jgi:type I restriction enzyme, S subunit
MSQVIESGLWAISTLGEALIRSDKRINPLLNMTAENYIGLEHIESGTGRLLDTSTASSEELRSTKNVFRPGDILYGKLRPYLNKVYCAEENGICSTDIWVLRATPLIDPVYASYYLRSTIVLEQVGQLTTGANLPRVSATVFDRITIPLPPLLEQRRIAAILREAEEIRGLRVQANEKVQKLVQALFYDMFGDGDPRSSYPEEWRAISFAKIVASTQYGLSESLNDEGDIGTLRMNNITNNGELDFTDMKYLPVGAVDIDKYILQPGDILFNRTNSKELVGKTGLWEETEGLYTFASYIIRVKLQGNVVCPEYIWALLNSPYGKRQVFSISKQAVNMANINTQELGSIQIILPPFSLQEKFAGSMRSIHDQLKLNNSHALHMDRLYQSLLAQALTGELTASWREAHAAELARAAHERDALLEQLRGAALSVVTTRTAIKHIEDQRTELIDELTDLQRALLMFIDRQPESYFSASRLEEEIREHLDEQGQSRFDPDLEGMYAGFDGLDYSLDALRRDLRVLAALGMIKEVALALEDEGGGVYFLTTYRSLRAEDDMQQEDLILLGDEVVEEGVA